MDRLQLRENEIFGALNRLKARRFVIIGGYAVNAYAQPRFSVDCDIVVEGQPEASAIGEVLLGSGYEKEKTPKTGFHKFERYTRSIANNFVVSFDVLIGGILDRQTDVSIKADWVFKNSEVRQLKGKTITERLNARIVDVDALFVLKMISCRSTDIRDLFMLAPSIRDSAWIRGEVASRCDFEDRFKKVKEKITSESFRDGLQGVYGLLDLNVFEKSKKAIMALGNDTASPRNATRSRRRIQ